MNYWFHVDLEVEVNDHPANIGVVMLNIPLPLLVSENFKMNII